MDHASRQLLSGNEAVALAARDFGVALGTGYPGTPSTEILERFHDLGGRAQWAPNEKGTVPFLPINPDHRCAAVPGRCRQELGQSPIRCRSRILNEILPAA